MRTRRKEPFVPRVAGRVGLYVCGLTVYDHVHIGHARTYTSFEVVKRWLEHRFGAGAVHHVMNVTDVDDRILDRAKELGVSPREHAATWDRTTRSELEALGVRLPSGSDYPHVTTSIPDIVRFIESILANGFAYATPEGNVYFDVPGYDAHAASHLRDNEGRGCGYGSLSNRDYKEMAAGTRKTVESDKRHPADFALWKAADAGDHPDASWTSPWGKGRPGWHIECSLMATRALGDSFDIHGGGQDLIFPHHENEIAQSQAKTGQAPFVNVWMHTGFLNVDGEKMSKSLHNFITLREALDGLAAKGHGADALRLYYIQTHYRSKIDYSRKGLDEAAASLKRLESTRGLLAMSARQNSNGDYERNAMLSAARDELSANFYSAMDDDIHTPAALSALHTFIRKINPLLEGVETEKQVGKEIAAAALEEFERCGNLLTLFDSQPSILIRGTENVTQEFRGALQSLGFSVSEEHDSVETVMARLLEARTEARSRRDWKRGDAIRDAAKQAGYLIEDSPSGQRWRKA